MGICHEHGTSTFAHNGYFLFCISARVEKVFFTTHSPATLEALLIWFSDIYVYIYIYTIYICIYTYVCIYIYIIHVYIYIYCYTYVYIYTRMYAYIHIYVSYTSRYITYTLGMESAFHGSLPAMIPLKQYSNYFLERVSRTAHKPPCIQDTSDALWLTASRLNTVACHEHTWVLQNIS